MIRRKKSVRARSKALITPVRKPTTKSSRKASLPVTSKVNFKNHQRANHHPRHLPESVITLVGVIGLAGAVALGAIIFSGQSDDESDECGVPESSLVTATPDGQGTPITCTTHSGYHYIWHSSGGGGWTYSEDGVHPSSRGGHGGDGGEGHGGVGSGHGGGKGG